MQYRREIDGLRAVAVLPVILFHAGFSVFSGGYVGVDVFFVISGYLITSILISELEQGNFSIGRFYERRARRILPALFLVMFACLPFAYMWMLPSQLKDFAQSLVAVVFFASNVLFWREDGYFAAAAELKPLLHTWSLAVEEQYYLLFPIFLLLLWRFGRQPVFWTVIAVAVASLLLAEWGWRNMPSANFYLAPTRAWELLAGSICAFMTVGKPQRSSNMLSAVGLAMIVFAIFVYDEGTPFPSVYALVPVVGTMLIILFAAEGTWVAKLLSLRAFVGIGLISYSAYLWHQPLFAFARLRSLTEPGHMLMGALAVASLLLAWATWRYVEQPFRKRANPFLVTQRRVFAVSGAVFVAVGLTADNTRYFYNNLNDEQREIIAYLDFSNTAEFNLAYRQPDCFYGSAQNSFTFYKKDICLALDAGRKNVLLMGDSHAAHLWKALSEVYPQYNVLQATASGCRPLLPAKGEKRCTDLINFITEEWLPSERIDAVVLSARWGVDDVSRMKGTIAYLQKFTNKVIVLGPTAEYEHALPLLLVKANEYDMRSARIRNFALSERFEIEEVLKESVENAGGHFVKIASEICSNADCIVYSGKTPVSWDYGHYTVEGAELVVSVIDPLAALNDVK
jgi:peptidoglycan/LPS O-acetylase OafA/YrhL